MMRIFVLLILILAMKICYGQDIMPEMPTVYTETVMRDFKVLKITTGKIRARYKGSVTDIRVQDIRSSQIYVITTIKHCNFSSIKIGEVLTLAVDIMAYDGDIRRRLDRDFAINLICSK